MWSLLFAVAVSGFVMINAQVPTPAANTAPEFVTKVWTKVGFENMAIGTVLATAVAVDNDAGPNGALTYAITHTNTGVVSEINPSTGVVTLTAPLDAETMPPAIAISVSVTDGGGLAGSNVGLVLVTLLDVNDNTPTFPQSSYEAQVSADGTALVVNGSTVATDGDGSAPNNVVTFTIVSGNDDGYFRIDSTTGFVSMAQTLDMNTIIDPSSMVFELKLVAEDGGIPALASSAVMKITIEVASVIYTCPYVWMKPYGDKCYKLVRGMKTWEKAQKYCGWLGNKVNMDGGNLATVNDAATKDFIVDNIMYKRRETWLGLSDRANNGTWTWMDGTDHTYDNWATINGVTKGVRLPSGQSNVRLCVAIEGVPRGAQGQFTNFPCTRKTWSVCQYQAIPPW